MTITGILDACDRPFRLSLIPVHRDQDDSWATLGMFCSEQEALDYANEHCSDYDIEVKDLRVPRSDLLNDIDEALGRR